MNILGIYGAFDWDANKSKQTQWTINKETGEKEYYEMPTWIHDSGATLFKDGKHVISCSEERYTRIKLEGNWPENSIRECLRVGNIKPEEVDFVILPTIVLTLMYDKIYTENGANAFEVLKNFFPNAAIKFISHHFCHATSSILTSDFDEGFFLTMDGAGSAYVHAELKESRFIEMSSMGYFNKKKKTIRMFYPLSNNLASMYGMGSYYIYQKKTNKEFWRFDEKYRDTLEGKIMGLSAYGKVDDTNYVKLYYMNELDFTETPSIDCALSLIEEKIKNLNPDDASAVLQKNFENAMMELLTKLRDKGYLEDYACFAGGCFLNVLCNTKIKESGIFKDIHIPPFTSDSGLHFGAAAWLAWKLEENISIPKNISLLGGEYTNEEIENALNQFEGITYEKKNFEVLCDDVAELLQQNKIVGWFQNRSEVGPRALGARSLLMNPKFAENKDIMNSRVKHREYWRPFAGIILEEYLGEYFENDIITPYMLYSLTVKSDKIKDIAAITHADNSCRIQTVTNEYNPHITLLLQKFHKKSGIPVVLNTSFNDNGEPIVESPTDAIKAFINLDIDCLAIGDYMVFKK